MTIAQLAKTRRTAKTFDPDRTIPAPLMEQLRTLLRHSPSSINSQPWHFLIAAGAAAKARIARATPPPYAYNGPKIRAASHVLVLCTRTGFDDADLEAILAQETADGRFPDAKAADKQHQARRFYVDLHRRDRRDLRPWMEKQVYLALGFLLIGAAALGIDACPMEGFDSGILDAELGLADRGLAGAVLVALGYRGPDDWNAVLPKSRLPAETLFTEL